MDLVQTIREMDQQITAWVQARAALQTLVNGGGKRRGRPPKNPQAFTLRQFVKDLNGRGTKAIPTETVAVELTPTGRPRRTLSAATKRKMAAAQKKRHADKRNAAEG